MYIYFLIGKIYQYDTLICPRTKSNSKGSGFFTSVKNFGKSLVGMDDTTTPPKTDVDQIYYDCFYLYLLPYKESILDGTFCRKFIAIPDECLKVVRVVQCLSYRKHTGYNNIKVNLRKVNFGLTYFTACVETQSSGVCYFTLCVQDIQGWFEEIVNTLKTTEAESTTQLCGALVIFAMLTELKEFKIALDHDPEIHVLMNLYSIVGISYSKNLPNGLEEFRSLTRKETFKLVINSVLILF